MPQVVIMPKQGQSVESCIITELKKKVGDKVAVGDVLFSYETDKASFDEESQVEGTVLAIFFNENDEVPVLTNVMVIGNPGESFAEFAPAAGGGPAKAPEASGTESVEKEETVEEVPVRGEVIEGAPVSPRARKLAAKKGVDTARVAGSGPHGRIIERDIVAAQGSPLSGLAKAMMASGVLEAPARGSGIGGMVKAGDLKVWKPSHTENLPGEGVDFTVKKLPHIRQIIAKAMYNSLQNSAQLTHMLGADARKVQALRKKAKKAYSEGALDANITINDFVCYAVIKALLKFPEVNSHCLGDSMRLFNVVNLGCAVDTERGLMVPAIKHADSLGIVELSKALKSLADDCKKGSVNPDLIATEAASFTVSNLGGYGVEWFTPVLNLPQTGILGVGTIVPRPVDLGGGNYEIVPYMGLSLTYDHRSIDGGMATRFLKEVADQIGNLDVDF
ncbi:MAG: 2-oxo acid dehydrogenase subunit E2 [Bacteroidales bacterium]|nr:2-oxo acid dehydrogenase subunit E2 [Bacteroidales bacterium]